MQTQQIKEPDAIQQFEPLPKQGLIIARPSSFFDWSEIMRASGRTAMPPQYLAAARYQTALPTSFSVWHHDAMHRVPLLVGGAVPVVNHSIAWIQAGPRMARHMLALIRFARKEWRRQKQMAVNQRLCFEVQNGHKPGQRMARLSGFERISVGQIEIWELK